MGTATIFGGFGCWAMIERMCCIPSSECACAHARVCVCACVRVRVRVWVRACVCVRVTEPLARMCCTAVRCCAVQSCAFILTHSSMRCALQ